MRVVVDARWIGPAPSGVGVYTTELLRRLPLLAPDLHWHLLFGTPALLKRTLAETGLEGRENVAAETLPYGIFAPEGQWLLPRRLRDLRANLFFSPNYMIPYRAFAPGGQGGPGCGRCVATIHDVIPLLLRGHAPRSRKSRLLPLFRVCLRQCVRRAAAVLTVSQTSQRDIVKALRLAPAEAGRVQVVYNGVDDRFVPPTAPPRAETRTLLYVGRLDPYKNVVTLVRAFALLRRQCRLPLHLLIVGPDDPRYPEARRMVADLDLQDAVTLLGFLDRWELVAAYQESSLLVNPSCYEGFGLPLVEAMRCGLPVVCCDGGAQAEIVGDAALLVPPEDTHALSDAMLRVLTDEPLRAGLVARGLARARDFTWERAAAETLAIQRRILEGAVAS
jgi:glycosyltransferase involved in cell wall biosynthesis